MQISDEMVEAFGNAFWSVNAASKIDGQREHIRSALEAALSTDAEPVAGKVQVHYAYCCPGSTKYCDCVNKNHGTAWIGANEVGDDYIPVAPPAPAVAVNECENAALRAFASSFKLSHNENAFYGDCYIHIDNPDKVSFRLGNGSQFSHFIGKLEKRRVAALSAQVQDVVEEQFLYRIEYAYRSYVEKKTMWGLYRELGASTWQEALDALKSAQGNNPGSFRIKRKPIVEWEVAAAPAAKQGEAE